MPRMDDFAKNSKKEEYLIVYIAYANSQMRFDDRFLNTWIVFALKSTKIEHLSKAVHYKVYQLSSKIFVFIRNLV